jgi:hypothetical protein
MSCTYTYKGNTYTYQEIKEIIPVEKEEVNSNAAKEWLADKLNMSDKEVSVVKGLIENKALGQIQEDGKILLSEQAAESIAYHEAFHRVYRMYVTPKQREQLIKEFKQRKNSKSLIALYSEEYKGLNEEDIIEEILAEEFREYVLTNKTTKPANKSLWDSIIEWLQKLFNVNKELKIKDLYAKINEAGFKDSAKLPKEYIKSGKANMLSFNLEDKALNLSEMETSELMKGLNYSFFQILLNQGYNPYSFSEGFKAAPVYNTAFSDIRAKLAESTNVRSKELAEALKLEDNLRKVREHHAKYIKALGFVSDEFDEDNIQQRNTPDWVNAVEISSKERMSKQVKMLLSAVPEMKIVNGKPQVVKNSLGLPYQKNNKQVIDLLLNKLAGIPASPENFINELAKIKEDYPEVIAIVKYIGGRNYNPLENPLWKNRLRLDFVQAFAKTKYEFLVQLIKNDGRIVNINANEDATTRAIQRQWKTNLELTYDDTFYAKLEKNITNAKELSETLGISLHPSLIQNFELMKELKAIATHLLVNKDKLDPKDIYNPKLDSKLKVDGRLNALAKAQLPFSDTVELQILNSENKPVYSISLNTYQTLLTNMINYYSEQGQEVLEKELPFLFNFYNNHSLILNAVISENKKLVYYLQDGTKDEFQNSVSTSRPSETTILQNAINNLFVDGSGRLKGVFTSIKHADRGVFPVYGFEDGSLLIDNDFIARGTDIFVDYLKDEVVRAKNSKELAALNIQYYSKKVEDRGVFKDYIDENTWTRAVLSDDFTKDNDLYNTIKSQIKGKIIQEINTNKAILTEYGLLTPYKGTGSNSKAAKKHVGIDNALLSHFDGNLDELLAAYTVNDLAFKVEQIKIYTGDVHLYKTMEDFYKRLNTQSSSGEVAIVDSETNFYIDYLNNDTFNKYGIKYNKVIDGKLKNVALKDALYTSGSYDKIHTVLLEQFKDKAKAEAYAKPYLEYTEPDGFSYINLFELREFLHRSGKWSDGHQRVFDKEMQVLKLMREGANEPTIKAKINELYTLKDELDNDIDANTYLEDILQPFVIEKPQYSGPILYGVDVYKGTTNPNVTGVLKTAILPLVPSIIYNTNLAKINDILIDSGEGIYSYDSATKVGIFEPNDSYIEKDGKAVLNEDFGRARELDYRFMKLQLAISHIPKDKIISSTQSTKMMMQDMYSEGKPRDFVGTTEEWKSLSEEDKLASSELHALLEEYQELFSELVNRGTQELLNELEATLTEDNNFKPSKYQLNKIETLKEVLKRQATDRSEPQSILDAIDSFTKNDFIETLPNSNKLWSIVFSLVSSKIKLKRAGTSLPQAASTMFETGERNIKEINDKKYVVSSDVLKFYEPIYENGVLVRVEPAEMIMPLPTSWIEPAFKKYKDRLTNKRSLPELIDIINEEIDNGNIEALISTKALRIPNQQFSSNDVLKVKKFTNPGAMQQMVIIPSEMVAKTGGDFDIDKLNIYFKNITKDFSEIEYSGDVQKNYKKLLKFNNFLKFFESKNGYEAFKQLKSEKETKRLLESIFEEPIENSYLSKFIDTNISYDKNVENLKKLAEEEITNTISLEEYKKIPIVKQNSKQAVENKLLDIERNILLHKANAFQLFTAVDDTLTKVNGFKAARGVTYDEYKKKQNKSLSDILSTKANMERTMEFMGGAIGIGIVATHSVNHSYGQVAGITINFEYYPEEYVDGQLVRNSKSTVIPYTIENPDFLGKTTNEAKEYISHIISALITSQVDMVKDPYASIMYLTTQTFPTALYMLRRGFALETVVKFLKQNGIQDYLKRERINQSPLYASTGRNSKKNPNGLQLSKKDLFATIVNGLSKEQTTVTNFTQALLDENNPKYQKQLLELFINIRDQAKAFDNFKVTASPDTKLLKSFDESLEYEEIRDDVTLTKLVDANDIITQNKILNSQNKLHNLYYGLFHSLALAEYPTVKAQLKLAKQLFKEPFTLDKAAKLNNALTSALMSYVLQKNTIAKNQFDRLFKGENSVAKRVAKLKKTSTNLAIREIAPLINFTQDGTDIISLTNISYQPEELDALQREMLLLKDTNEELYNDLVIANLYQTAIGYRPKSITQIVPNEFNKKLNEEVMNFIKSNSVAYNEWLDLLPLALPDLLATQFDAKGKPYKVKTEKGNKVVIEDVSYEPLSTPYYTDWNKNIEAIPPTIIDVMDEVDDYSLPEPTQPATSVKPEVISTTPEQLKKDVKSLLDKALKELKEANATGNNFIIGFHGGKTFDKPDRNKQYTGEFRNPESKRIAESMGARYEGQMLFYTEDLDDSEFLFTYEDAINGATGYAIKYGDDTPSIQAYLIPVYNADFANRGVGEVGVSYDDIEANKIRKIGSVDFTRTSEPTQPFTRKTYSGKVTSLQPNQIFVFGSNEGSSKGGAPTHGAGSAKIAREKFGAIQGQSRGLQGQSYGIVTKKFYDVEKSSTPEEITKEIQGLYEYAKQNPTKEFLVSDYSESNLNGYTGQQMADMFVNAGTIPSNIVFNNNFDRLIPTQPSTIPTVTKMGDITKNEDYTECKPK